MTPNPAQFYPGDETLNQNKKKRKNGSSYVQIFLLRVDFPINQTHGDLVVAFQSCQMQSSPSMPVEENKKKGKKKKKGSLHFLNVQIRFVLHTPFHHLKMTASSRSNERCIAIAWRNGKD
jgi:hypothetical protein